MFPKINKFFLDVLFPIFCLYCGKEGSWLCPDCFEKIELLPYQVCPFCEEHISQKGSACPKCSAKIMRKRSFLPIDSLLVATKYKTGDIAHLVHLYKYSFVSGLSVPLGRLLVRSFVKNNFPLPDFIIPVPLHPRRIRWRGFNQAELIAEYISLNLTPAFPISILPDLIIRKKYTLPQMRIKNYAERLKNIRGVFEISDKNPAISELIKNKRILLIDDIATTGATLFKCGTLLKQSGAKEVFCAVIARQEFKKN